jgi:hypothetical protein
MVLPQYGQGMKIDTTEEMKAQIIRKSSNIFGNLAKWDTKTGTNDSQKIILTLLYLLKAILLFKKAPFLTEKPLKRDFVRHSIFLMGVLRN